MLAANKQLRRVHLVLTSQCFRILALVIQLLDNKRTTFGYCVHCQVFLQGNSAAAGDQDPLVCMDIAALQPAVAAAITQKQLLQQSTESRQYTVERNQAQQLRSSRRAYAAAVSSSYTCRASPANLIHTAWHGISAKIAAAVHCTGPAWHVVVWKAEDSLPCLPHKARAKQHVSVTVSQEAVAIALDR